MVRLVVEDGGPGVPAEALGSLFERFRRETPAVRGLATRARASG